MPLTWLPTRRYVIPARRVQTARGSHASTTGTLFSCTDDLYTGWGDVPDAVALRAGGQHAEVVAQFAESMAQLHLEAQQQGMSLAAWLHAEFPQWTVPPRKHIALQALVDLQQLAHDPQQKSLRALGLTCLKVKLTGRESQAELREALIRARRRGWTLRLDVNGAWQGREDLDALLRTCAESGVAYVEDPVPVRQLDFVSPVALAADAIDSSVKEVMEAALAGRCQVVVVKPPLWGSVAALLADVTRLRAAGVQVVLSSSFESAVGLAHLAHLAAVVPTELPAGLPTHLLWQNDWQPASLQVQRGKWSLARVTPAQTPRPPAMVQVDGGHKAPLTFSALQVRVHTLAALLRAQGVVPDSIVATWAGNTTDAVVAWHATRLLSATWLPLHPRLTPSEVQTLLNRARPAALIADALRAADLNLRNCRFLDLNLLHLLRGQSSLPATHRPTDRAALLFTSGSTGPAKGVLLPASALTAAADAALAQFGTQHGSSWLCCLPICHVSGLLILERATRLGMSVVLADQPSTSALAELFTSLQPRLASLVPAQLTRLLDEQAVPHESLLAVLIGGAPCPPELVDRARAAGWPVLPSYGMTETAAQVATAPLTTRLDPTPWPRGEGEVCVGPPIPGVELRISSGEILVRSAQLLSGYLGERAPLQRGWLHTGDLGRLDGEGWLWVTGRRGELILRGGENVTPDEVEAALLAMPGVREACVVGVEDRVLGQRVAAWLTVDEVLPHEVLQAQLQGLAAFKRPEVWLQTTEPMPRTGPGKVARGTVRDRLTGKRP